MTLFVIQPFLSHYYPSFGLAHMLLKEGKKVVFTTKACFSKTIAEEGFDYHEFQYLSEYIIKNYRSFIGVFLKGLVSKEFYQIRHQEFHKAYLETRTLIKKYAPTKVYLDQSLADYYYFFKPHVDEVVILHTKFYSGRLVGIPPMNSFYIPRNNPYSKVICDIKWNKLLFKQRLNELLLKIAFLSKHEISFWKKHCKKYNINWSQNTDTQHALNRGVKDIEQLVLAPKELEFSNFKAPTNIKFYDKPSTKNENQFFSERYSTLKKKLVGNPKKKVLYLSFGTLHNGQIKIETFFNHLIRIVGKLKNTTLIISLGKTTMNLITSKNTIIFDFIPQLDVLTFTDLFITHGGLGSVKEAYYANVPMLVVPFNKKTDMPGNAARVKASGRGDYLNLSKYSRTELEKKIKDLLRFKKIQPIDHTKKRKPISSEKK